VFKTVRVELAPGNIGQSQQVPAREVSRIDFEKIGEFGAQHAKTRFVATSTVPVVAPHLPVIASRCLRLSGSWKTTLKTVMAAWAATQATNE
jgi:hypothetical protein